MKTVWMALLPLIIAVSLAGCKQQSVSRTYHANMDATWNAVVAVAKKVSKDAPKLDTAKRRITTGIVMGGVTEIANDEQTGKGTTRALSAWRGVITLSPEYGGTKVSVKVEKATGSTNRDIHSPDEKNSSLDVTLWSNNTDWQKDFLNRIAAEIAGKG